MINLHDKTDGRSVLIALIFHLANRSENRKKSKLIAIFVRGKPFRRSF